MNLLRLGAYLRRVCPPGGRRARPPPTSPFPATSYLNTDIVEITFGLNADATDVKVWTDSFQSGVNYDPITALWHKVGSDYV